MPIDTCKEKAGAGSEALIPKEIYLNIFQFVIQYRRILAGAFIKKIYQKKHRNYSWLLSDNDSPILFFSPNPENDLIALQSIIGKVSVDRHAPISDVVPGYIVVRSSGSGNNIICIIIEEYACHSYNIVRLQDNSEILVASLDTAIRLFYSLGLVEGLIGETSIHCVAQNLVDISMKIRSGKLQSEFPLFSIECMGHQHTKGSLIRVSACDISLRSTRIRFSIIAAISSGHCSFILQRDNTGVDGVGPTSANPSVVDATPVVLGADVESVDGLGIVPVVASVKVALMVVYVSFNWFLENLAVCHRRPPTLSGISSIISYNSFIVIFSLANSFL